VNGNEPVAHTVTGPYQDPDYEWLYRCGDVYMVRYRDSSLRMVLGPFTEDEIREHYPRLWLAYEDESRRQRLWLELEREKKSA
jgi:hypothetical protein